MSIWAHLTIIGVMVATIAISAVSSAAPVDPGVYCPTPPKAGGYSFPADQVSQLLKQLDDQTIAAQNQHTQYVDKVMTALGPQLKELLETGKTAPPPAKPGPAFTGDGPPAFSMEEPSAWDAMMEPMVQRDVERAPADLMDTVQSLMRGEPMVQIEPVPESRDTQSLLDSNPRQVLPDAPDLVADGKDLEKSFQQQIDGFKQLNALLSKLMKDINPVSGCLQSDINAVQGPCADFLKNGMTNTPGFCDADALKTYVRVAKAYVAAIFAQEIKSLGDKLVSDHLMTDYLTAVPSGASDFDYYNSTPDPAAIAQIIYKMPQAQVNRVDEALSLATRSAIDIMKVSQPNFAAAVRIELLRAMAPILFAVNDRTKHLGPYVPSRALLLEYVSRIDSKNEYTFGKKNISRIDHNRIPAKLALFDPQTKIVVDVPLCKPNTSTAPLFLSNEEFESDKIAKAQNDNYKANNGTSGKNPVIKDIDQYMPKNGSEITSYPAWLDSGPSPCVSFKTFANVATNFYMLGDGKKPFFDWARYGTPCYGYPQGTPSPKTSWVNQTRRFLEMVWNELSILGIREAHADDLWCKQLDFYSKVAFCKDSSVAKPECGGKELEAHNFDNCCVKSSDWGCFPPISSKNTQEYAACLGTLKKLCSGLTVAPSDSDKSNDKEKDVSDCLQKCAPENMEAPACKLIAALSKQSVGVDYLSKYFYSQSCKIPYDVTFTTPIKTITIQAGKNCMLQTTFFEIEYTCQQDVTTCQQKCWPDAKCGNGIIEFTEECDPPKGEYCSSDCKIPWCPECTIASPSAGPSCSLLNKWVNTVGAQNLSKLKLSTTDDTCTIPFDIPPFVAGDKKCIDAFHYHETACKEKQAICKKPCIAKKGINPMECGNGRSDPAETCDDGNTKNGDGCNDKCQKEPPICGNGKIEKGLGGESCDDGNTKSGDGCNNKCQTEWCTQCTPDKLTECADFITWNKAVANSSCILPNNFFTNGTKPVCLAGEPCTCRLKYDALICNMAQDACNDSCSKILGLKPPPQLTPEECAQWKKIKKSPWWWTDDLYNFDNAAGFFETKKPPEVASTESTVGQYFIEGGAKKFLEIWPTTVSWAEYFSGKNFLPEDREAAKNYALEALEQSTVDLDIDVYATNTIAQYDSSTDKITWGKAIQVKSIEDIVNTGAHEATHAALYKLFNGTTETAPMKSGPKMSPSIIITPFPSMFIGEEGAMDHYIMVILQETFPGFNGEAFAWGGTNKDDLCPKDE